MPLINRLELTKNSFIAIWQISESVQELSDKLPSSTLQLKEYKNITSEKRKSEWLCSKIIVKHFFGEQATVLYKKNGSPYIENQETNISITHNGNLCCVLFSDNKCGIDIEDTSRNFEKVSKRFLCKNEQKFINTNTLHCISWCAKETIYKFIDETEIDFKKDFIINKIDESEQCVTITYKSASYKINYFYLRTNILSYIIC